MGRKALLWEPEELEKVAKIRAESTFARGWNISVAKYRTAGVPDEQKEEFIRLMRKAYEEIKKNMEKDKEKKL